MELFGIGILELLFILVIILLVAGPKDIARTARNLGRALNRLYRSPSYQAIRRASDELRNLPQRLAREAQLEELTELKELEKELRDTTNRIGIDIPPAENRPAARPPSDGRPYEAWLKEIDPPAATSPEPNPLVGIPRPETTAALRGRSNSKPPEAADPTTDTASETPTDTDRPANTPPPDGPSD
jgi:Sec-independent protein translocase protein TatA